MTSNGSTLGCRNDNLYHHQGQQSLSWQLKVFHAWYAHITPSKDMGKSSSEFFDMGRDVTCNVAFLVCRHFSTVKATLVESGSSTHLITWRHQSVSRQTSHVTITLVTASAVNLMSSTGQCRMTYLIDVPSDLGDDGFGSRFHILYVVLII